MMLVLGFCLRKLEKMNLMGLVWMSVTKLELLLLLSNHRKELIYSHNKLSYLVNRKRNLNLNYL